MISKIEISMYQARDSVLNAQKKFDQARYYYVYEVEK